MIASISQSNAPARQHAGLASYSVAVAGQQAVSTGVPDTVATVSSTWSQLPSGVVAGSEIVILAIKPSLWQPVLDSAAWVVASAVLGISIISMNTPLPGLSAAATGQLIFLVGIARLIAATLDWASRWYVLTNQRVLDVRGLRSPVVWACPLLQIRNTYVNSLIPAWQARLRGRDWSPMVRNAGIGSITFVTEHPKEPPRCWKSVPNPALVHDKIRRAIEGAIDDSGL